MKVIRFMIMGVIVLSTLFTVFFVKDILNEKKVEVQAEYKGILTLWQIDSFEGGTGSRKQFLLKASRTFEKKNQGVLVMVINHTKTSMLESLSNGLYPDMISFGGGADVKGFSEFNAQRTVNGGLIGGKVYATAWCKGGYFLIANPNLTNEIPDHLPSLLVSQNDYTQPLTSLYFSGIKVEDIEVKKPMDAYVKFVSGKTPYFLGTQRDVIRLSNRGMEVLTRPIQEFNDLYQYVCITSKDREKIYYSEQFISHLTCDDVQKQLFNIGMYSPFINVEYDNVHLSAMQNQNNSYTLSAFTDGQTLEELQCVSLQVLKGNSENENKIKNLVV
ncbi:MAG: hypothetical protein J6C62_04140 [Clostridia bacterium]|nr:hypothetical protein [Clostridia bacterium]